jgi:hypothetical protein
MMHLRLRRMAAPVSLSKWLGFLILWPEEAQSKENMKLVVNALAAPLSSAAEALTPRTVLDASAEGVHSVLIGSVYE